MGLAASTGKDNDELVDNLIDGENIYSEKVELVMRLVDRGRYFPPETRGDAYKDSAWKAEKGDPGHLHLSAPCIYASVLENLDLRPGMSFLNVGCGTGYLSTMAGFLLGEKGINHGVELYDNIADYAFNRLEETLKTVEVSAFSWCPPQFFVGNAFLLKSQMQYDRMYCGALVPSSRRPYFCNFLKIGGICVMPFGNALQKLERTSENNFKVYDISAVTFSNLILPTEIPLTQKATTLPGNDPHTLRDLCRQKIRYNVREAVADECKLSIRIQLAEKNKTIRRRRRDRAIRPMIFFGGPENEDDEDHPARIFDIFGHIQQADDEHDDGEGGDGENQDGTRRNRRDREERNNAPEEAFTFEPVRPPRPPGRRGRVQPISDSESDREGHDRMAAEETRPIAENGANTNRARFDSSSSSSSDSDMDLRHFRHRVGSAVGQAQDRQPTPRRSLTPRPQPTSNTEPQPGPSSGQPTSPRPISDRKLQEIRKYFEEPSSNQNFDHRPRGHRIQLIGGRVRTPPPLERLPNRGVRFNAVRVPDIASSDSSGDEGHQIPEEPERDRERDPGPRNITGILRDLMRLRRRTVRLQRAAAPLVRNIPRARSATTLQNQTGHNGEQPLSDGDIGAGEGSSTNSSAYASARGSSIDVNGERLPESTRNNPEVREHRRARVVETLEQQQRDLDSLQNRLDDLQQRMRLMTGNPSAEETAQIGDLINRRDAQQNRILQARQDLAEENRSNRQPASLARAEARRARLLQDQSSSSSRTRPFTNADRAQSRERLRNLLQERAEVLEPRRWNRPEPNRSRSRDGPPVMGGARSPPRNLAIRFVFRYRDDHRPHTAHRTDDRNLDRGESMPTLHREDSIEFQRSEVANSEQDTLLAPPLPIDHSFISSEGGLESNCACTSLATMLTNNLGETSSSMDKSVESVPFHRRESENSLASSSRATSTSRGTMTAKKRARKETHSDENMTERKRRPEPPVPFETTISGEDTRDVDEIFDTEPMEQDVVVNGSFSPPSEISHDSHFTTDDNQSTVGLPSENGDNQPPNLGRRRALIDDDSDEEMEFNPTQDEREHRLHERRLAQEERELQESAEERDRLATRQRQIDTLNVFHENFSERIRQLPLSAPLKNFLLYKF